MKSDRTDERVASDEELAEREAAALAEEQEVDEAQAAEPGAAGGSLDVEQQALNDRYLRLAAEYDNYRKRTERERGEAWIRAQADLVKKILDPLDDLQRVADYTVDNTTVEALIEGVQMVERKLLRALEGSGLEVIDASGQPFDPAVHEALMTVPTAEPAEDDSVGDVFQKGYGFKGVLLRPARVQVRKLDA